MIYFDEEFIECTGLLSGVPKRNDDQEILVNFGSKWGLGVW